MSTLLSTHALQARYGDAQALFGIDFTLNAGEVVAIIGANGAGKPWTSILVRTGVFRDPSADNDATDPAHVVLPSVWEAAQHTLSLLLHHGRQQQADSGELPTPQPARPHQLRQH